MTFSMNNKRNKFFPFYGSSVRFQDKEDEYNKDGDRR